MFEFDELKIFRAKEPIEVGNNIFITIPTIGDIEEYGEKYYFNAIRTLTSVSSDFKWQLYESGVDYTEIDDYTLFVQYLYGLLSSKKHLVDNILKENSEGIEQKQINQLLVNPLQLILKDIDLADFTLCKIKDTEELILYNKEHNITIDRICYKKIVQIVREIHSFKRNNEKPANEATKMILIEDAKEEYEKNKNTHYKSLLKPILSALTNSNDFSYNHDNVWKVPINIIFDSLKRINKIQDSKLLLQGAYSGFASLKGIDIERLNWSGDI